MNLRQLLTDEELVHICTSLLAVDSTYGFSEGIAGQIVTAKACKELEKETGSQSFNIDEVTEKVSDLVADKCIELMVRADLISPNYDKTGSYTFTDKGLEACEQVKIDDPERILDE